MKKGLVALLLTALLGTFGLAKAGATPNSPGYAMSCYSGTDHCVGQTSDGSLLGIWYIQDWNHTFDPNGNGVWDTTTMQWYIDGVNNHAIGWTLHALSYDWAVPHMFQSFSSNVGILVFAGHYISYTTNVLRWSPCSSPSADPLSVSGAALSSSTGYFNCWGDGSWHNGGGWEWLNGTYTHFNTGTGVMSGYWSDNFTLTS